MRLRSHPVIKIICLFIASALLLTPFSAISEQVGVAQELKTTFLGDTPSDDSDSEQDLVGNSNYLPQVYNKYSTYRPGPSSGNWPMAGANPQRNSWTSEEVRGRLTAEWYKPFEPYIYYAESANNRRIRQFVHIYRAGIVRIGCQHWR
jgi:hypothetical protein